MAQIHCIENTLVFNSECAEELRAAFREMEDSLGLEDDRFEYVDFTPAGLLLALEFNTNHDEHQDYLSSEPQIRAILRKHRSYGKVRFASLEGDTAGEKWSHVFDGEGGYKRTRGRI